MVLEEVLGSPIDGVTELITKVGNLVLLMQAVGIILILWLIFQSVALWFNYKRMKAMAGIKKDMDRIEKKIDSIKKK